MVRSSVDAFQDREGTSAGSHGGRVQSDRSFVIEGLAPGKLRLLLRRHGPSGIQTAGSTEVEVTDQNISGLVITQWEPATVRVRVMMEEEETPLTVESVYLNPADTDTSSAFTNYQFVPDHGAYVMNDVVPGKYLVGFTNVSHCFLKTVTSGDREISRDAVDVTSGAHPNLAAEDGDLDLWNDDDFRRLMLSAGTPIQLHEKEHAKLCKLSLHNTVQPSGHRFLNDFSKPVFVTSFASVTLLELLKGEEAGRSCHWF